MNIVKCPNCKKEIEAQESSVLIVCGCGESIDPYGIGNLNYFQRRSIELQEKNPELSKLMLKVGRINKTEEILDVLKEEDSEWK